MSINFMDPELRNLLRSLKPFLGNNGKYIVSFSESALELLSSESGQRLFSYLKDVWGQKGEGVTTMEAAPKNSFLPIVSLIATTLLLAGSANTRPAALEIEKEDHFPPENPEDPEDNYSF